MADFYITAVRMDSTGQHIQDVQIYKAGGKTPSINSRQFVGELISTGKVSFSTLTKNARGEWVIGAKVEVMSDGYITTDPNRTKRDNLGNLPRF
jgi:nitrous oxidase accessory protein NosD